MRNASAINVPGQLSGSMFLKLTALLVVLGLMSAADLVFRGLRRYPLPAQEPVWSVPGGAPARGREAIERHGCAACHTIPGVRTATRQVGPDLTGLKNRMYVAGVIANTPENLVAWIRNPREIDPQTAMPNLGVTQAEARDIAAYLYSRR